MKFSLFNSYQLVGRKFILLSGQYDVRRRELKGKWEQLSPSGIALSVNSLEFLQEGVAEPSPSQSYVVSGKDLQGDIEIMVTDPFEISLEESASEWTSSIVLERNSDMISIEDTTVYVRLNSSTAGIYTGRIMHNSERTAKNYVLLNGECLPELATVTTKSISDLTNTQALSGGIIVDDGGGIITQQGVCWNTIGNPTISDSKTIDEDSGGDFVSTITPLLENTEYYVRAYAVTVKGVAYGNEISFTSLVVIKFGKLYNWYAVTNVNNLAPTGWHIPTKAEYDTLIAYLSGELVAGGKMKSNSILHWGNTNGSNTSGFTGKGNGKRDGVTGNFSSLWEYGYIGTSTAYEASATYSFYLLAFTNELVWVAEYKKSGVAIRCIKDDSTDPGMVEDVDGNTYPTVKIGNQVWMADNLIVSKYRNGDVIPEVTVGADWLDLITGAWCAYNNDHSNV